MEPRRRRLLGRRQGRPPIGASEGTPVPGCSPEGRTDFRRSRLPRLAETGQYHVIGAPIAALGRNLEAIDYRKFDGEGGMWFPLDAQGVLQLGYASDYGTLPIRRNQHPLTGQIVTGRVHPRAPAMYELALRAHRAFPDLFTVGWDIAYGAQGLFIVEFNVPTGIDPTSQDSTGGFIGTRLSAILAPHAGLWLAGTKRPLLGPQPHHSL